MPRLLKFKSQEEVSCGEEKWCNDSKRVTVNMGIEGEQLFMFQKYNLFICRALLFYFSYSVLCFSTVIQCIINIVSVLDVQHSDFIFVYIVK